MQEKGYINPYAAYESYAKGGTVEDLMKILRKK